MLRKIHPVRTVFPAGVILLLSFVAPASAQESSKNETSVIDQVSPGSKTDREDSKDAELLKGLLNELRQLRLTVSRLEERIERIESERTDGVVSSGSSENSAPYPQSIVLDRLIVKGREAISFYRDMTFNLMLDGSYSYNFNRPVGGINLLRAYDPLSNNFNLNQAAVIIEQAPDPEAGRRFGMRLDMQFGQATETVQGNAANESRPQVYRHVWQAYGTYVAPIGRGLTVDFGKFAGSLGYETNYTKDNFNYSRAYFFNYLPFYHFGFRAAYPVSDKLTATYWLVNGANQSEDFNGFKSQALLLTYKPSTKITWQANYYIGQEQRDRLLALNPTFAGLPTQPGLSTELIRPMLRGRFHVIDTYLTYNPTDKLTLAIEGDYVVNRVQRDSAPSRVTGGVAYARYQLKPQLALAGRFEYLSDRGGLFSGTTQALKEATLTADYKLAEGFMLRTEWRRDYSNQPFFLSERPEALKREQTTATLGLIWWMGRKEGSW